MPWPFKRCGAKDIEIRKDHVAVSLGGKRVLVGGFRIVGVAAPVGEARGFDDSIVVARFQHLLNSFMKNKLPLTYVVSVEPKADGLFEADIFVLTRAEGSEGDLRLNLEKLKTAFDAALPHLSLERMSGKELADRVLGLAPRGKRVKLTSAQVSWATPAKAPLPAGRPLAKPPQFYRPNASEVGEGEVDIGYVVDGGEPLYRAKLPLSALSSHVAIFGATGSGKSTTCAVIISKLLERNAAKVLIFDWHGEYAALIERYGGVVYRPGLPSDEFAINPLNNPYVNDLAEHVSMVAEIFAETYNFTHPQSFVFKEALRAVCAEKALGEEPNLKLLVEVLEGLPITSVYEHETKMALLRRIKPLVYGQAGRVFASSSPLDIRDIVSKNVAIELWHLRETKTRQILVQLLLKQIFDLRVSGGGGPLHVTVIEEARNIVPYRRPEMPQTTAERMIAEVRKFSESVVVISQFPTEISSSIAKNCGMLVIHRLSGSEDLRAVEQLIPLTRDQLEFVKQLAVGEAIIKVSAIPRPILIKVEAGEELLDLMASSRSPSKGAPLAG